MTYSARPALESRTFTSSFVVFKGSLMLMRCGKSAPANPRVGWRHVGSSHGETLAVEFTEVKMSELKASELDVSRPGVSKLEFCATEATVRVALTCRLRVHGGWLALGDL